MNNKIENNKSRRIWVAWETQRRSIELSAKVKSELFIFDVPGKMRYLKSFIGTIRAFLSERPDIIFVQNPSMILATFACLYQILTGTPVVVDRHTTFLLTRKYRNTPNIIIFKILHRFTIRVAALTIITNSFLADIVERMGGRAFVLPDPLPKLVKRGDIKLSKDRNIVLISSFGLDEPIEAVFEAMRQLDDPTIQLHITGNYRKLDPALLSDVPKNITMTGFLPDQDFIDLLDAADAIMALTTADHCMLCGCYEALSMEKPLITSDKSVLKEYFSEAIFVDNSAEDISRSIRILYENRDDIQRRIVTMKRRIQKNWEIQYRQLEKSLTVLQG